MIQQLVEPVKKLDYRTLCESLIRTFGMGEPVNWDSSLPAPQQQQLFGGELLRIIADHPTIALQHDIRALCWPKGTVSQLLFLFVRLNDDKLPKSQIERITRRFVGGLEAERYTVWFFGNPSQTMLKVVLAGREGKKAVCKTLTLEAGQWYKTYDLILNSVGAIPAGRPGAIGKNGGNSDKGEPLASPLRSEPSLLWKAIWQAFDISIVNKNFYRDIKAAFDSLITSLSNCKGILTRPEQRAQFAVRLLGRLIFCWFLKKKGIVGSNALSSATVKPYVNYYHELLEPLFFDVFNTPVDARKSGLPSSISELRFLNGGLFEPQADDCQGNFQLLISNDWFAGFFGDTMERYNFTVDENSATNAEIAIDPEMLGRIFENLLAEQNPETGSSARSQTGSFYTPREIVDYMVEESLIAYLGNDSVGAIPTGRPPFGGDTGKGEPLASPLQQCITDFVHTAELSADLKSQAPQLLEKLNRLKTIDIAAGSGAFPIGMLQKIVMLKQALNPKASPYDLKLETIENSIYGVDIQPMAIELSRLRCWLSLIVDEEPDKVQPLPNLDFKFVCADSLIDLGYKAFLEQCAKRHGFLFLGDFEQKMDELKKIRHDYFDPAHDHSHKKQLKKNFLAIQDEILKLSLDLVKQKLIDMEFTARITGWNPFDDSKAAPFFSPAWMFGIEDGFDISIGNPPYIQIQSFSGQPIQALWESQKYDSYARTGDIYCLFYERGFGILAANGTLSYITSNQWMKTNYGKKLRLFFATKTAPQTLIDFGDHQVFESATVNTNIIVIGKQVDGKTTKPLQAVRIVEDFKAGNDISGYVTAKGIPMVELSSDSWIVSSGPDFHIRKQIEKVGTPLKRWDVAINRGLLTGRDEAFIITRAKRDELIAEDPKSAEIIKPLLRGRDIKRYKTDFADLWIIATFPTLHIDINNYPAVRDYLKTFGNALEQNGEPGCRKRTSSKWFELQDNIAYYANFEKEKIAWGNLAVSAQFALVEAGMYIKEPSPLITPASKYMLAILNSTLGDYYIHSLGVTRSGGYMEYKPMFVENLPVPQIPPEAQRPFETLVDKILEAKKKGEDTSSYEAEIDKLVYALYGLTDDQIAVVEGK
jgi:hypothetical protein